jgi:calcium-dependent protein kinase
VDRYIATEGQEELLITAMQFKDYNKFQRIVLEFLSNQLSTEQEH